MSYSRKDFNLWGLELFFIVDGHTVSVATSEPKTGSLDLVIDESKVIANFAQFLGKVYISYVGKNTAVIRINDSYKNPLFDDGGGWEITGKAAVQIKKNKKGIFIIEITV